jgi:hypothetical protein
MHTRLDVILAAERAAYMAWTEAPAAACASAIFSGGTPKFSAVSILRLRSPGCAWGKATV